jgi:uncharacterized repeat protein (TIGR03803 family)
MPSRTIGFARRAIVQVAAVLLGLSPCAAAAASLTTLYAFKGGTNGRLYGTTYYGGAYSNKFGDGGGTVFELVPPGSGHGAWTETILANFYGPSQGQNCSRPVIADRGVAGFGPQDVPAFDPSGNLYVAASSSGCDEGTVVELSPEKGGLAIANVLQFQLGYPKRLDTRGNTPLDWGGLLLGPGGAVYGTTVGDGLHMLGEVFRLAPGLSGNVVTLLYSFPTDDSRGDAPETGVIVGPGGLLYGTTSGGFLNGQTIFRLLSNGGAAVLHSFSAATGIGPGPLTLHGGKIYGTTANGGTLPGGGGGQGVVYELALTGQSWTYTVLHTFGYGTDGAHPSEIVFDKSGAIYGNAMNGGRDGVSGVIFKLAPPTGKGTAWTETIPWYFTQGRDAGQPSGKLVMDAAGALYGTTVGTGGGPAPFGTVFKLVP